MGGWWTGGEDGWYSDPDTDSLEVAASDAIVLAAARESIDPLELRAEIAQDDLTSYAWAA